MDSAAPLGSILGPPLSVIWTKIRQKSNFEMYQKYDRFWYSIFNGFWSILGPKMEPNWTQNGIKNRSQLQHANFQKSLKNQRKINTFGVPRGRSWDRKSTKNRSEKEVPKGARLGIDFGWIWDGFGVQVEPQNGPKSGKNRPPPRGTSRLGAPGPAPGLPYKIESHFGSI